MTRDVANQWNGMDRKTRVRLAWVWGATLLVAMCLSACHTPEEEQLAPLVGSIIEDDLKIHALVFRHLIDQVANSGNTNVVCFLEVLDPVYPKLVGRLKGSPLQVKFYRETGYRSDGFFDPVTGKPGVLLTVLIDQRSLSGIKVYGMYSPGEKFVRWLFTVKRDGEGWRIESVEDDTTPQLASPGYDPVRRLLPKR